MREFDVEDGGVNRIRSAIRNVADHFDTNRAASIRLSIGIIFLVLAVTNLIGDASTMASGRWSWLYLAVHENFGSYGWPIMQSIIGTLFIVWSLKKD